MKKELVTYNDPRSPITENFKALRTNIQFMGAKNNIKSILITSTLPGEGKSWNAANLAITFAQAGNSVIIIDADMRKGRQFSLFDIPPRPGLSNYLSGVVNSKSEIDINDLRNFIKKTEIDNLYVMPAGDVPPNPSELLMTSRMLKLIKEAKALCDVVIIDTPPAMLVTDSKIISRLVDTSLIVVAHKDTKMDNLKKVKKDIEHVGGKVGGIILNKMEISTKKYGNGYYGETAIAINSNKNNGQDIFFRSKKAVLEDRKEKINKSVNPIKKEGNAEGNNQITIDKTQDILKQINSYLDEEKRKINNGEDND